MAHARRCHNLYYTIPCGMHNKQACTTACHMISWEFHSWNIPDWWYITAFRLYLKQFCHYGRWSECTPQSILIIKYGFQCQEQIAWLWKPIFWHHFDFSRLYNDGFRPSWEYRHNGRHSKCAHQGFLFIIHHFFCHNMIPRPWKPMFWHLFGNFLSWNRDFMDIFRFRHNGRS